MKVTLLTNFRGLMDYKAGLRIEASARHIGRSGDYVHEIQVDVEEIHKKARAVGHVYVQRKHSGVFI